MKLGRLPQSIAQPREERQPLYSVLGTHHSTVLSWLINVDNPLDMLLPCSHGYDEDRTIERRSVFLVPSEEIRRVPRMELLLCVEESILLMRPGTTMLQLWPRVPITLTQTPSSL